MHYTPKRDQHHAAALREKEAARQACSDQTAHIHDRLAELHSREAARLDSVSRTLDVAFGS